MVTFPHWAEGSVAVVGLPAGGSWRRGAGRWAPSLYSSGSQVAGPFLCVYPRLSWFSSHGVGPLDRLPGPLGPRRYWCLLREISTS